MKKLLLSLTAIVGTFVHAQTELYNTEWSLKKIVKNNITYNVPSNSEIGSPSLTFTPIVPPGQTTNMRNDICGTYIWATIFNAEMTANSFNVWAMGIANAHTCTLPENIAFFNQHRDYLTMSPNNFNYQINNSNGVKNLIITNSAGDQAFYQFGTLGTKDINSQLSSKAISLYPNPVKEGSVHLKNAERIEWIKVYNTEGKLILQDYSTDAKINVSNLLKGGYFMEVKSQSGISRHQFIKE
ncbi:T9SS type A sorting domain-containing protein [Chryseobacterium tructae]|uniref:T9SS type A sorting domain-containing protein n=1 Tax=Chryseobacterium tructae TaxID=1037380 RepID=A0ABV7XYE7_9FLAO|nr:T9SS type A sorting domain-containing protein [Chryseobacterium tructae]MDN3692914.1 T9SS type A sorting domain-containing protein [Chryseobacterium tructae]